MIYKEKRGSRNVDREKETIVKTKDEKRKRKKREVRRKKRKGGKKREL